MSFDKKEDISKLGTVELSDDALDGVSGGVTMPNGGRNVKGFVPPSVKKAAGFSNADQSASNSIAGPQVHINATLGSLDQAIANTEEDENRIVAGLPNASLSDLMLENNLGLSRK